MTGDGCPLAIAISVKGLPINKIFFLSKGKVQYYLSIWLSWEFVVYIILMWLWAVARQVGNCWYKAASPHRAESPGPAQPPTLSLPRPAQPRHRRIKSKQHYYLASTYNYHNTFIWFCGSAQFFLQWLILFSFSCLSVAFGEMGTLKHFNGIFNIYSSTQFYTSGSLLMNVIVKQTWD